MLGLGARPVEEGRGEKKPGSGGALAFVFAAALSFAISAVGQARAQSADLNVEVSGLRNYRGHVVFVLWADSDQNRHFPDYGKVQLRDERAEDVPCDFPHVIVCRRSIDSLQNLTVAYTFRDVPQGEYAVFAFHDENSNGVFDRGIFNRPLEARGYSEILPDDIHPFGVPITFQRARFTLAGPKTIVIGLRYPPFRKH